MISTLSLAFNCNFFDEWLDIKELEDGKKLTREESERLFNNLNQYDSLLHYLDKPKKMTLELKKSGCIGPRECHAGFGFVRSIFSVEGAPENMRALSEKYAAAVTFHEISHVVLNFNLSNASPKLKKYFDALGKAQSLNEEAGVVSQLFELLKFEEAMDKKITNVQERLEQQGFNQNQIEQDDSIRLLKVEKDKESSRQIAVIEELENFPGLKESEKEVKKISEEIFGPHNFAPYAEFFCDLSSVLKFEDLRIFEQISQSKGRSFGEGSLLPTDISRMKDVYQFYYPARLALGKYLRKNFSLDQKAKFFKAVFEAIKIDILSISENKSNHDPTFESSNAALIKLLKQELEKSGFSEI